MSCFGRKLIGGRTTKSRLSVVRVTESQFADDAAFTLHLMVTWSLWQGALLGRLGIGA